MKSPAITIRRSRKSDRKAILALVKTTKIAPVTEFDGFYVAEVDGRVVGCGRIDYIDDKHAVIRSLAVLEEYRKFGIGSMLTIARMQEARRRKLDWLAMCTMYYWFRYYKNRGFRTIKRKDLFEPFKSYQEFVDPKLRKAAVMVKPLSKTAEKTINPDGLL